MNPSLSEILENMRQGLLWVSRDGVVRHVNTLAGQRTGLGAGRRLFDPDLTRTVAEVVQTQVPKAVKSIGVAPKPGQPPAELLCRVIPGLVRDDAFVLVASDGGDGESGVAFDNLMTAIREDLGEPLRTATQGLQRARRGTDPAQLETLLTQVEDLTRVVEKLVDLASVWGSDTLMAADRIEMWPLLQKVWSEVEPLAQQRKVTARFQAGQDVENLSTLYGSEVWLARVFRECLESAVRSTPPGGVLEIEHRQMGPRALVVFRDCGVFAKAGANARAMDSGARPAAGRPGAAPAPAPARRQAREEIGFKLAQHIIALHGGLLREEDDQGIHNFLIDLPTGAPHRMDSSQLDIAQAQQYAKDLAALMARARNNKRKATPAAG